MIHQLYRAALGHRVHIGHGSLRKARRFCRLDHDIQCLADGLLRSGMGREHDGIAGFHRDQCLIYGSRYRTCCRTERSNDAHGHTDIHKALLRIVLDHSDAASAAKLLPEIGADKVILGVLILPVAEIRLIRRQDRQFLDMRHHRVRHGFHDGVQLFLREQCQPLLCVVCIFRQNTCFLDGEKIVIYDIHL